MTRTPHQYIDRATSRARTERFVGDPLVRLAYGAQLERPRAWVNLLTSRHATRLLAYLNYDRPVDRRRTARLAASLGIDLTECLDPASALDTPRKLFERRIRFWDVRPMDADPAAVVSPADARLLPGSLVDGPLVFVKEKFFAVDELLGRDHPAWLASFRGGDVAIFRLTPDRYHYTHTPVAGVVLDVYGIAGRYHSCNPAALVVIPSAYSKNARVVTILDTDVPGGTGAGLVAMVEVVALMVGRIEPCYSAWRYDGAVAPRPGLLLEKGQPRSLFRPGSSTVVLLFQPRRIAFSRDLVLNSHRTDVHSRFSRGLGLPIVETDVEVRSTIATARGRAGA